MEYTDDIMDQIKEILKVYNKAYVLQENNSKHYVTNSLYLLNSRGSNYRLCDTFFAEDFYSAKERQLNYINSFVDFPPEYKGRRDMKLLQEMATNWKDGKSTIEIVFDEYGNFVKRRYSLIPIGNGSGFNSDLGNTAYLLDDEENPVLIDCGSTVFAELKAQGRLLDNLRVMITHLHTDHIGSLGTLVDYYYHVKKERMQIIVPEGIKEDLVTILTLTGVEHKNYRIETVNENEYKELFKGFSVAAFRTKHVFVEGFKSYGFQIKYRNKKIIYSGDWRIIPKWLVREINSLMYDELYLDVSMKDDNPVHLTIRQLGDLLIPEALGCVTVIHKDV